MSHWALQVVDQAAALTLAGVRPLSPEQMSCSDGDYLRTYSTVQIMNEGGIYVARLRQTAETTTLLELDPDAELVLVASLCRESSPKQFLIRKEECQAYPPLHASSVTVLDMRRDQSYLVSGAFDLLTLCLNRRALEYMASSLGSTSPSACRTVVGGRDIFLSQMIHRAQSVLTAPEPPCRSALSLFVSAISTHLSLRYVLYESQKVQKRSGLMPWQQKRAMELLKQDFSVEVSLHSVAAACRLSVGHFTRAFRISFGTSALRWRSEQKLDAVKEHLIKGEESLADTASAHGFADQSTFTRWFSRSVGFGPNQWRRQFRQ